MAGFPGVGFEPFAVAVKDGDSEGLRVCTSVAKVLHFSHVYY